MAAFDQKYKIQIQPHWAYNDPLIPPYVMLTGFFGCPLVEDERVEEYKEIVLYVFLVCESVFITSAMIV